MLRQYRGCLRYRWVIYLLMGCIMTSCPDSYNCYSNCTSDVRIQFKSQAGTSVDVSKVLFDQVTKIQVVGSKNEDTLYQSWKDNFKYDSKLFIPLNPKADHTDVIFHRGNTKDTLRIFYNREVSLISHECGAQQAYTLTQVESIFEKGEDTTSLAPDPLFTEKPQIIEPQVNSESVHIEITL